MSVRIDIYTDGACKGNPGPGGWGALLTVDGTERELFGGEPLTTNNRMELRAVIEALGALDGTDPVRVHTDSQYVQKGISEWIVSWKRRGWKTADNKPVKNQDLWQQLDALAAHCERLGRDRSEIKVTKLQMVVVAPTMEEADADLREVIDDVTHCRAYYQLLIKALLLPGLMELADTGIPTHLVICERDRVLPHPRFTKHFTRHIPDISKVTTLDNVGHIPMFEAPQLIADLIVPWVDEHRQISREPA